MLIKSLENTPLSEVVAALLEAFADYFVKMPEDLSYWENRFRGARLDLHLSFGVFQHGKLVAFILHGIDENEGLKTAFNTGTGVIRAYRGRRLVDNLYAAALPKLRRQGIEVCKLEVIQENARAIRVYERIGFEITRHLKCYTADLAPFADSASVQLEEIHFKDTITGDPKPYYAWDNTDEAILSAGEVYQTFRVWKAVMPRESAGYFVLNPRIGYVAQLAADPEDLPYLLAGLAKLTPKIRLNNTEDTRTRFIQALEKNGFENTVNQYEMRYLL